MTTPEETAVLCASKDWDRYDRPDLPLQPRKPHRIICLDQRQSLINRCYKTRSRLSKRIYDADALFDFMWPETQQHRLGNKARKHAQESPAERTVIVDCSHRLHVVSGTPAASCDYATAGSYIRAANSPVLLCVSCSHPSTLELLIRPPVRISQAPNADP